MKEKNSRKNILNQNKQYQRRNNHRRLFVPKVVIRCRFTGTFFYFYGLNETKYYKLGEKQLHAPNYLKVAIIRQYQIAKSQNACFKNMFDSLEKFRFVLKSVFYKLILLAHSISGSVFIEKVVRVYCGAEVSNLVLKG